MGKQKRARQKFHLASIRWRNEEDKTKLMEVDNQSSCPQGLPSGDLSTELSSVKKSAIMDNLFSGVDIDLSKLKTSLLVDNDDAVSIRSIAKSLKSIGSASGKHMKKVEKRKLRHNLFIQKIDAIYQDMKKKKIYKKMKGAPGTGRGEEGQQLLVNESKSELDILNLGESSIETPDNGTNHISQAKKQNQKSGFGKKLKGIKKTNKRKKEMLKDINIFKQLISETTRSSCPLDAITSKVEEKVFEEQL